jgi:integrase
VMMFKIRLILNIAKKGLDMPRIKQERDKFIDKEQFEALVRAARKSSYPRAADLLLVAGMLGLRIGEAVTLNRGCFKRLASGFVSITTLKRFDRAHPIKRVGSDRAFHLQRKVGVYPRMVISVPVSQVMVNFFKRLLKETPLGQVFLFPGRCRGHISKTHAQRIFHEAAQISGLGPQYSFHSLRHHQGLMVWEELHDYEQVKLRLRHSSAQTSMRYSHLSDKEAKAGAERIDSKYNADIFRSPGRG